MPRPHPVVGFTPVISDGTGWGIYDTNILEYLMDKQDILLSIIHFCHRSIDIILVFGDRLCHLRYLFIGFFILFRWIGDALYSIKDLCRDIFHFSEKPGTVTRSLDFIAAFSREKSIDQEIAVYARCPLEGSKRNMMIGNKQSVFGYKGCCSSAQLYNRIGDGGFILAVYIADCYLQAFLVKIELVDLGKQPHPLLRMQLQDKPQYQ